MTLHRVFVSVLETCGVFILFDLLVLAEMRSKAGSAPRSARPTVIVGARSALSTRARTCRAWRGVGTEAVISLVVADGNACGNPVGRPSKTQARRVAL
jgi:hypothetical protein